MRGEGSQPSLQHCGCLCGHSFGRSGSGSYAEVLDPGRDVDDDDDDNDDDDDDDDELFFFQNFPTKRLLVFGCPSKRNQRFFHSELCSVSIRFSFGVGIGQRKKRKKISEIACEWNSNFFVAAL